MAILDLQGRDLGRLEFAGLPVVAHLRPRGFTLLTQAGQIFRWLRNADPKV